MLTYTLGNASVVLWDRDEPRYAQTSKQMLESGDWVVPRLLDEPREKKPAMIYWLQASAMKTLGPTVFAARLPSALFVTATVVLLAMMLRKTLGDELAMIAAAVLASSLLVIVAAKLAITDGVLLLFSTLAQLSLAAIFIGDRRWRWFVLFGIVQGLALLTKGPVIPAVSLATALIYWLLKKLPPSPGTRGVGGREGLGATGASLSSAAPSADALSPTLSPSTGRGRVVFGLLIAVAFAVAIFMPWWIAIEHRSPGWTWRVLHNEVLNRAASPQEGHRGPPGYYLASIWFTFLPWSFFLPASLMLAWRDRDKPGTRFALAAIIGPWIVFEISATKLVHYLLPIYPALAFLVAKSMLAPIAVWGRAPAGLLPRLKYELHRPRYLVQNWRFSSRVIASVTMVLFAAIYAGIVPRIPELRVSKRLAEALINDGATQPGQEMMIDYKENSLAFYQGGTIRPESENNFLLTHPPAAWPKWLVISDAIWKRMPPEIQSQWTNLRTVHGWNLAGRDADKNYVIDVHVLRKK